MVAYTAALIGLLACTPLAVLASQLTFSSPPLADSLLRISFLTRADAEAATAWMDDHEVDVWSTKPSDITARLSKQQQDDLAASHLAHDAVEVLLPSVQDHLSAPTLTPAYSALHSEAAVANISVTRLAKLDDPIHDSYHSLDSINQILRSFQEEFPGYAKLVSVGFSAEGREIWGLKVTNHSYAPPARPSGLEDSHFQDSDGMHATKHKKRHIHRKLGFVVAAGQHAREWIAPSVSLYIIHDLLLATRESQSTASSLLNNLELTFVPTINPDGYAYTWAPDGDRLWRKNRQPTGDGCFGVDMNRNWGFHWAKGSRPNPCSDAYAGSEAFESPELQALTAYMMDKKNNVKGFLDVHSFGQMLMFPFSYKCTSSPDEENHFEGVVWAAKALRAVHGKNFEVGSVCEVSLTAPGDSIDWAYAAGKIRWSFAVELRGGIYGFLLPPTQIRPSGEEMSAAFIALADYVVRKEQGQRFDFSSQADV